MAFVPTRLSDAALVNTVATSTEAKAQAMWELGLKATGTATDAAGLCPQDGPVAAYGGPRSTWRHHSPASSTARWSPAVLSNPTEGCPGRPARQVSADRPYGRSLGKRWAGMVPGDA